MNIRERLLTENVYICPCCTKRLDGVDWENIVAVSMYAHRGCAEAQNNIVSSHQEIRLQIMEQEQRDPTLRVSRALTPPTTDKVVRQEEMSKKDIDKLFKMWKGSR